MVKATELPAISYILFSAIEMVKVSVPVAYPERGINKLYVFPDFDILEGFELVNTDPEPPDWDIEKSETVNAFTPDPFMKSVNTSSLKVKLIFKLFWLIEEAEIWYEELSTVIVKLSDPE